MPRNAAAAPGNGTGLNHLCDNRMQVLPDPLNLVMHIIPLDRKGCICHFTKWQIHPFIPKGANYAFTTFTLANPKNMKHLYKICKMLDQHRRRWADVVQMLYKCFVFTGMDLSHPYEYVLAIRIRYVPRMSPMSASDQ